MQLRRAFTLIELLVVIAIIAILAAILFPVFAQAKLAAKKTQDLSNHKQMVTAIMLYANDNDDHTMVTHHDLASGETIANLYPWFQPLNTYVKSTAVFRSPVIGNEDPTLLPPLVTLANWRTVRSDYLINGFFAHGASLNMASKPAEQIIIAPRHRKVGFFDYHPWASAPDDNWERGFLDGSGMVLGDVASDSQVLDKTNVGLYSNGNNYSFTDGHAKWMPFSKTLDPTKTASAVDNFGMHNIDSLPSNED